MSRFLNIVKIRDSLGELSETNFEVLTEIANGNVSETWRKRINDFYTVTIEGDTIRTSNNSGTQLKSMKFTDISSLYTTGIADDSDISYGMVIDDVAVGANLYEKLSQVSAKFAYTDRVKLTDIDVIINDWNSGEGKTLKNYLYQAANREGYLTSSAFFTTLNEWMKCISGALDDNSVELDQSNPYAYADLFNVLVQTIGTFITLLISALKGIFAVLLTVIAAVIRIISSAFEAITSKLDMIYNIDCANDFVAGPMLSTIIYTSAEPNGVDWGTHAFGYDHDRRIHYAEDKGIALFTWWNDNYDGLKVNAYMYPYFKPGCYTQLINANVLEYTNVLGEGPRLKGHPENLTDSVLSSLDHYTDSELPADEIEVLKSLFLGNIIRSIISFNDGWSGGVYDTWYIDVNPLNSPSVNWKADQKIQFWGGRLLVWGTPSTQTSYAKPLGEAYTELYVDMIIPYNTSILGIQSTINPEDIQYNTDIGKWIRFLSPMEGTNILQRAYNPFVPDSNKYWRFNNTNGPSNDMDYMVDCIPSDFGIRLPRVVTDKMIFLTEMLAVGVTIAAIGYSVIGRIMRKKKLYKQYVRSKKIADAKALADEHPDDPQYVNAYIDEVIRYDRLGKWFGWGSYDMQNAWFDGPSASSSVEARSDLILREIKNLIKS
jgi:hypothetical protein